MGDGARAERQHGTEDGAAVTAHSHGVPGSSSSPSGHVGKRRIAFAADGETDRPSALPALLRGLALAHPGVCEDFLVPYDDGTDPGSALDAATHSLHPRLIPVPPPGTGSWEAVRTERGYDTLIVLDPVAPVPGDLGPLLRARGTVHHPGPDGPGSDGPGPEPTDGAPTDVDAFRAAYCALPEGSRHPELFEHFARPLLAVPRPPVNLTRELALVLYGQGRYEEAVRLLERVADRVQADQPRFHETFGAALMAVSRYDEAETHLLLATAAPHVAASAFARLAQAAWLRGRDASARTYARDGLDAEPGNRACRALLLRAEATPPAPAPSSRATEQLAHVALYSTGQENAGDKVLPESVRMCFGADTGPERWLSVPVHRLFGEEELERVNARRGLVIGGGGLFLPDTWPNGNSAWQWNVTDETIARITVPVAVFAVGYNVFDGQSFGGPGSGPESASWRERRFRESLRALVERSAFFGLRNHGSVERVRELLPARLRDRVRFQPCPTTVARHLIPGWREPEPGPRTGDGLGPVLLNCAYDRAGLRFGHDYGQFLEQMAHAVRRLGRHARVRYAAHMPADERFVRDLRREHGITLPVDPLYDASNEEIYDVYARAALVIGMRGHATMIPFGCGTPVLSLVSHPKMAYFLADIGRPEWGFSVHRSDLGAVLSERGTALLSGHAAAVADVRERQDALWKVTQENLAELRTVFGGGGTS
ncbi:polysaccharide pyruvyl transferase family protein [Streptomyces sp. NPDC054796]